jgi:hypothetical protein
MRVIIIGQCFILTRFRRCSQRRRRRRKQRRSRRRRGEKLDESRKENQLNADEERENLGGRKIS